MGNRGEVITYDLAMTEVDALCASDARLAIVIKHYGHLSYTLHPDPAAFLIETIVGQMLSNKAANAIIARLYNLCGGELTITKVLELDITSLKAVGLSRRKSEYILGIAKLLKNTPNYFEQLTDMSDEDVIKHLTAIHGIGAWSAKMYLIFVLDRKDVLPFEDGAFKQVYRWLFTTEDISPTAIKKNCDRWRPHSSIAARYLYRALDEGLTRDAQLNSTLALRLYPYREMRCNRCYRQARR